MNVNSIFLISKYEYIICISTPFSYPVLLVFGLFLISQIVTSKNRGASRYSQVRQSHKPIVLLSVSIVLNVMSIVVLAYFRIFQFYKRLVRLHSRTIDTVVKTSVSLVLSFAGISIHQSRIVYRKPYFLQQYRCTNRDQCIVSPTFCRNIDTIVKTSVSLVLLSVVLSIHHSYVLQYYRYTSQDSASLVLLVVGGRCRAIGSEMRQLFIIKTLHILYHHMKPQGFMN